MRRFQDNLGFGGFPCGAGLAGWVEGSYWIASVVLMVVVQAIL